MIQFGGQTPLKLARAIEAAGFRILGTPFDAVDLAEDRERFGRLLAGLGIRCPDWGIARSGAEAAAIAHRIGYPVLVRPSYVLGGRAMRVCHRADQVVEAFHGVQGPTLVDRFLESAVEIDVDALCDGTETYVGGDHAARRGGRRALGRLRLRAARAVAERGRDRGDLVDRQAARAGARRRRTAERPARRRRRRGVRARGEPARVAHRPVRVEGDRRQPRRRGVPARRGRAARRPRAAGRAAAAAGQREGRGAAVRALPGRRPGARARDARDRRGDGERERPADGAREGRARRRPLAAARRRGLPLGARRRQGGGDPGRGRVRRARLPAVRDARDGPHAARRRARRRRGAEGERAGRRAERRRPDPARPLQPRSSNTPEGGSGAALGRLPDPGGGARGPRSRASRRSPAPRRPSTRSRTRVRRLRSRSRSGSMSRPRRERLSVTAVEAVGPYALVRVERGGLDPGVPGPVLHARGAGPRAAAPDVVVPRAAAASSRSCSTRSARGRWRSQQLECGDRMHVFGPLGNGFRLDVAASAARRRRHRHRAAAVSLGSARASACGARFPLRATTPKRRRCCRTPRW